MNEQRLLRHYQQIADAPGAVARLRRFILDLAVRGKLVAQDEKDEPALELLKRIAIEKARLDRKRSPERELNTPFEDAERSQLPRNWALARLADLVTVLNGRAYKQHELLNAGTPVLRVGNLFTSDKWYYSDLSLDEDKYCNKGDLIFAWSASFGPFIWDGEKVIYHYHIWKLPLHSDADLDKGYLYNFLIHKTREIKEAGHGISMVHMTKEKMQKLLVPVPPLAEQRRIVTKIDELMALCDQLEESRVSRETVRDRLTVATLARLNAPDPDSFREDVVFALESLPALTARGDQITRMRKTILNLAVRGKLTPQDAGDEPAAGLLERIAKEKSKLLKQRGIKVDRVLPDVDESERYFSTPSGWCWARAQDLSLKISDGVHKKPNYVGSGVPFVTVKNLTEGPGISFRETKFITERDHAEFIKRTHPEKGDLLITKDGTIGVARIVETDRIFSIFVSVALMKMVLPAIAPFLALCINSDVVRDTIVPKGAALKHLHLVDLRKLALPLPPLAEQQRIVAKVDVLMALCDRLEAGLVAGDDLRRRILDALLAEGVTPSDSRELEAAE
ncbi:restriction endonuclease subunit S [Bradyrhizobium japonicum]|uniref:restriction endonuclease subunit S n=1 Tax=Bradyrhizobium japonicum TaxID=375 RepID=UPI001BA6464F|nr:restriction endonuclease subunit S [Bradyrhizobium japonicum]MBR0749111.1 restriction endonuclease subunit S [Bradyrhizobium japonicum]